MYNADWQVIEDGRCIECGEGEDWNEALEKAGWQQIYTAGNASLGEASVTVYQHETLGWWVEIGGQDSLLADVACAHPGEVLRILRQAQPLLAMVVNIWQQEGAPIATAYQKRYLRDRHMQDRPYVHAQEYLVTSRDEALDSSH